MRSKIGKRHLWIAFSLSIILVIVGNAMAQDHWGGGDWGGGGSTHSNLTWSDYPSACLNCHQTEYDEMFGSTHYKWVGEAPDMVNGVGLTQGKLTNGVNSYCINILGDWPVCGSCHAGRGLRPDDPNAGLDNIDCLVCHNEEYATQRVRLPDGSMGVANPTDSMVQNIAKPTRANCLMCHAKAGGGDGVKRGDLSLALINNSDPDFDYHMNTYKVNLSCQSCHKFQDHLVIGKGSDIRPTDDLSRGSEVDCATCHQRDVYEHSGKKGDHLARVACQTCHIPVYAKFPTETHRDWRTHHDGSPADGVSGPGHPHTEKGQNLIPEYKWWNRMSDNYLMYDDASSTYDPVLGTYPTSRPIGDINNGKIYPFKYKTADQPKTISGDILIALDTLEYLKISGNVITSIEKGLDNMGLPVDTPYEWITTDTYQLINHGVVNDSDRLRCDDCHRSNRMDFEGLGYLLKGPESEVCRQCHGIKENKSFYSIHNKHVDSKGYDCSYCHTFSRPERNLKMPGSGDGGHHDGHDYH